MDISEKIKNKCLNSEKLLKYGFVQENNIYKLEKPINDNDFLLTVTIDEKEKIHTKIIDICTSEEYTLHLADAANGAFVSKIREEHNSVIEDILKNCFELDNNIFKEITSKKVIKYIKEKYNDNLEFLWKKSPNNAIWRRKDTRKWYGVMLTVSRRKFGLDSDEFVEVLNFMTNPGATSPVDFKSYFPAYHMNKKNWCSVILNSAVATEEICKRLDYSRMAASGKKPKP